MTTTPLTAPPVPSPARLAGAGGLATVTALLVSFFVVPADDGRTSAAGIAARYGADGYLLAVVVQAAGVVCLLVFAAGLTAMLARAAGGWTATPVLVALGAAVSASLQLAGYSVIATLATGRVGEDAVLGFYDLSSVAFVFASGGTAMLLAGAAAGLLRLGRRWSGGTAAALAVVSLAAAGSLADAGFFGVHGDLGFLVVVLVHLWLLGVSVALLRRPPA